jgi:uncharacterized protein (DUF39 family)
MKTIDEINSSIGRLVAGERLELHAQSYGTDDDPHRGLRTRFTFGNRYPGIITNPRPATRTARTFTSLLRSIRS